MSHNNVNITRLSVPITLVVAAIMQLSVFVWWAAQTSSQIDQIQITIDQITDRKLIETTINVQRDIKEIREDLVDVEEEVEIMDDDLNYLYSLME